MIPSDNTRPPSTSAHSNLSDNRCEGFEVWLEGSGTETLNSH